AEGSCSAATRSTTATEASSTSGCCTTFTLSGTSSPGAVQRPSRWRTWPRVARPVARQQHGVWLPVLLPRLGGPAGPGAPRPAGGGRQQPLLRRQPLRLVLHPGGRQRGWTAGRHRGAAQAVALPPQPARLLGE